MVEQTREVLKVAIAGAGIAGLTAAIALSRHPGLDIQIYEKASELREIGAGIALGPNGLRTLEKLGVDNALDDDVAFRGPSSLPMIYRHWKTNEVVSQDHFQNVTNPRHETARFLRAHLQQSLLQHVPRERIHVQKGIQAVQADADSGATITFADGSSVLVDVVIGADGINSRVRKGFVPNHKLSWTGQVAYRSVFDAALVEGIPDLPEDSTHWWGPNKSVFCSKLGRDKFASVGFHQIDPEDPKHQHLIETTRWGDEVDIDSFRSLFADWNPVVTSIFAATPSTRIYPNIAGAALPAYAFNSRVVLIGDAAHTHGGAFAAGGSLAIEDAYALALALFEAFPASQTRKAGPEELGRAFALYERTRKPHTTRLLQIVHAMGKNMRERIATGKVESDEELRKRMVERAGTSWLHEHDVEAAFRTALEEERRGLVQENGVARL